MGTEVLRPQDCLIERIPFAPTGCSRRRFNRKPVQRKRIGSEQAISKRFSYVDDLKTVVRNNVTTENVTILRRVESLDLNIKSNTDRLSPNPEMVSKQIKIVDIKSPVTRKSDVYAGSAFAVSPAPSSLPLPSFSKKKQVSIDDSATRDLRRLLRLDL
ncbi:hypothetical protein REPUB_Repub20aG0116700 [Reevesia pubescens]